MMSAVNDFRVQTGEVQWSESEENGVGKDIEGRQYYASR